jgi:hypothetical protein
MRIQKKKYYPGKKNKQTTLFEKKVLLKKMNPGDLTVEKSGVLGVRGRPPRSSKESGDNNNSMSGLFTKVFIKKGQEIGEYRGHKMNRKDLDQMYGKDQQGTYVAQITDHRFVDARDPDPTNLPRYANSVRNDVNFQTLQRIYGRPYFCQEPNARLESNDKDKVFLVAIRNISPGREILSDYGERYWTARHPRHLIEDFILKYMFYKSSKSASDVDKICTLYELVMATIGEILLNTGVKLDRIRDEVFDVLQIMVAEKLIRKDPAVTETTNQKLDRLDWVRISGSKDVLLAYGMPSNPLLSQFNHMRLPGLKLQSLKSLPPSLPNIGTIYKYVVPDGHLYVAGYSLANVNSVVLQTRIARREMIDRVLDWSQFQSLPVKEGDIQAEKQKHDLQKRIEGKEGKEAKRSSKEGKEPKYSSKEGKEVKRNSKEGEEGKGKRSSKEGKEAKHSSKEATVAADSSSEDADSDAEDNIPIKNLNRPPVLQKKVSDEDDDVPLAVLMQSTKKKKVKRIREDDY